MKLNNYKCNTFEIKKLQFLKKNIPSIFNGTLLQNYKLDLNKTFHHLFKKPIIQIWIDYKLS